MKLRSFVPVAERAFPRGNSQTANMERVLASGRLLLGVCSFIEIHLDPTQPAHDATLAYALLAAYVIYSSISLVIVVRREVPRGFIIGMHTMDLCWAVALVMLTARPGNPFYLFFVFVLLAAAFRWGFWETLVTTAAAVSLLWLEAFLISAQPHYASLLFLSPLPLTRFITVTARLLLIGFLVGLLGEEHKRQRSELSVIAHVTTRTQAQYGLAGTMNVVLDELLQVFSADRAVLAIGEIRSNRAYLWEARVNSERRDTVRRVSEIAAQQKESWFFPTPSPSWHITRGRIRDRNPFSVVALDSQGRRRRGVTCTLPAGFVSPPEIRSVLMVSIAIPPEWSGRVYVFKSRAAIFRETELRLLQALVQAVSPAVYNAYLSGRLRSRTKILERSRLSRELHDGVVQFLGSLELQMEAVRHAPHAPPAMIEEVARIQKLLQQQAANLRELMQRTTPLDFTPGQLVDFLRDTVSRFRLETGIAASFTSRVDGATPSPRVCHELARILQEALVNVRKHSGAQTVSVQIAFQDAAWRLIISDDGRGFDFAGRLSHPELDSLQKGPAVIKDRVHSMQGELTIESVPNQGTCLEITIPQQRKAMATNA